MSLRCIKYKYTLYKASVYRKDTVKLGQECCTQWDNPVEWKYTVDFIMKQNRNVSPERAHSKRREPPTLRRNIT
jgi:hypothetical protein